MTICRQPARLWTFGVLAGYFNERISIAFVRHALYERDDADAEVHRHAGLTKAAGARTTEHALNNAFCREKPSFRGGSLKGASIKVIRGGTDSLSLLRCFIGAQSIALGYAEQLGGGRARPPHQSRHRRCLLLQNLLRLKRGEKHGEIEYHGRIRGLG